MTAPNPVYISYPLASTQKKLWKIIISNGEINCTWPCSIAIFVITNINQTVTLSGNQLTELLNMAIYREFSYERMVIFHNSVKFPMILVHPHFAWDITDITQVNCYIPNFAGEIPPSEPPIERVSLPLGSPHRHQDFIVTVMLQQPEVGGEFEFAPMLRGANGEENYEKVGIRPAGWWFFGTFLMGFNGIYSEI